MKENDIVQTNIKFGNAKKPSKMRVLEVQEDMFEGGVATVTGLRILKDGRQTNVMEIKENQILQ